MLDNLAIADGLAPILASAPSIQGNPRIVKRLLNTVFLRRMLAAHREMNIDLATLAKLAVFERCTDGPATLALYRMVMAGEDAEKLLLPSSKSPKAPELPQEWTAHVDFIEKWRAMKPAFDDASKLRPPSPTVAVQREADLRSLIREVTGVIGTPILEATVNVLTPSAMESLVSRLVHDVEREISTW